MGEFPNPPIAAYVKADKEMVKSHRLESLRGGSDYLRCEVIPGLLRLGRVQGELL